MKVPLSWLKKYISFSQSVDTIADILTLSGLEVEKIDRQPDPVLDIALTPDLGHCRSVIGVARELAPHIGESVRLPAIALKEDPDNTIQSRLSLVNEAHTDCPQYFCRLIQGVDVKPSPAWLVELLTKAGHQSINNVVDFTNFVMLEMGQPLHAFDYDHLPHKKIAVRRASHSEKCETLDGIMREVPAGTLLIYDDKTPIAIAGIMGSLESGVSGATHTIVLEAAQFSSQTIRASSKKLGVRTEASSRFEYGIDPAAIKTALNRAASLIVEHAGGRILKGILEQSPKPYTPRFLTCRASRLNALLGTKMGFSEIESLFSRLGVSFTSDGTDLFQLKVPSHRGDIQGEIDVIAEIAKLYGYNNIERAVTRPANSMVADHPLYTLEYDVRTALVKQGLQQFITADLISPELANLEIEDGRFDKEYISVLHAKSVDQSILRISLLPGLLAAIKHNQNHKTFDIAAFEIGRIHFKSDDGYTERLALGIVLTGATSPIHFNQKTESADFYHLKGIVESLQTNLLLPPFDFHASSLKTFHPGRQASLQLPSTTFGVMGEIHPSTLEQLDIRGRVLYAELDLELLSKHRKKHVTFSPLPQFPSSERDLTLTLPLHADLKPLFQALHDLGSPLLKQTTLLSIYTGQGVPPNEKRVSLRFIYRDDTKTLELNQIEEEHTKVVATLSRF